MVSDLNVRTSWEGIEEYNNQEGMHNIMQQGASVHVGPENVTMGCPNLVQGDSDRV